MNSFHSSLAGILPKWPVTHLGFLCHLFPVVGSHDSPSAGWCLVIARWRTNSILDSPRYHRTSLPVASAGFSMHLRASWSVCTVDWVASRTGSSNPTPHTTGSRSRWVGPHARSASANPVTDTHSACRVSGIASGVVCYLPLECNRRYKPCVASAWRKAGTRSEMILHFKVITASISSSHSPVYTTRA